MKLGIMQPYLFPYIGYFQLIRAVDVFVALDDVQWINRGWINRNRYLIQGRPLYFTLPVEKGASSMNINQRVFAPDIEYHKQHILRQIGYGYGKAPHFDEVFPLVSRCFSCKENNVSAFIVNSLRECCTYLNIATPIVLSSELDKRNELKAQERMLDINRVMGSHHYINPIGGIGLYDKARFEEMGVRFNFIRTREVTYPQFKNDFLPSLSVIDVMMFNSVEEISRMLEEFNLE